MRRPDVPRVPLEDLYKEVILDHNRRPRNYKVLEHPDVESHAYNPLCGDDYHLYLKLSDGLIQDVSFQGKGCAISKSSASMMTAKIKGKERDEVLDLKKKFIELCTLENSALAKDPLLGNLTIFKGVRKFPIRVKCATMVWHALEEALSKALKGEVL